MLFIGTPYNRRHDPQYVNSLMFMETKGNFRYLALPDLPIDHARTEIANQFLESDCKYLIFIDNDCVFPKKAITRLMSRDVPMVCGGMWTISIPTQPTMGRYMGHGRKGQAYYNFTGVAKEILEYAREYGEDKVTDSSFLFPKTQNDLRDIDGCGMHFTMIRRDVIEAIKPPRFVHLGMTGAGEDFYFCQKVRKKGYPIYTDLSVQTGHSSGRYTFGLKDFIYLCDKMPLDRVVPDNSALEVG